MLDFIKTEGENKIKRLKKAKTVKDSFNNYITKITQLKISIGNGYPISRVLEQPIGVIYSLR